MKKNLDRYYTPSRTARDKNLDRYYDMNVSTAKAKYHSDMINILTIQMENTTDRMERNRICARRTHHRKLYRKYHALAEAELLIKREPHGQL